MKPGWVNFIQPINSPNPFLLFDESWNWKSLGPVKAGCPNFRFLFCQWFGRCITNLTSLLHCITILVNPFFFWVPSRKGHNHLHSCSFFYGGDSIKMTQQSLKSYYSTREQVKQMPKDGEGWEKTNKCVTSLNDFNQWLTDFLNIQTLSKLQIYFKIREDNPRNPFLEQFILRFSIGLILDSNWGTRCGTRSSTPRLRHRHGNDGKMFLLGTVFFCQNSPRKSRILKPKLKVWKMISFFRQVIFRFHVNFPGCTWNRTLR